MFEPDGRGECAVEVDESKRTEEKKGRGYFRWILGGDEGTNETVLSVKFTLRRRRQWFGDP